MHNCICNTKKTLLKDTPSNCKIVLKFPYVYFKNNFYHLIRVIRRVVI